MLTLLDQLAKFLVLLAQVILGGFMIPPWENLESSMLDSVDSCPLFLAVTINTVTDIIYY